MESIRPSPAPNRSSKLARTFQKVIHLRASSKPFSNNGFCLLIPQEKLKCCESQHFDKEEIQECKENSRNRAVLEAFVAKLFATISSLKAAYAELQMAQFPYNSDAIQAADQAVVDELKALSELKHSYLKKQVDSSPPHVTLMLAEIQEQQSLMKTYEITMKKMQGEIEGKEALFSSLQKELQEISLDNKSLERKLNASGSFTVLDNVRFSDVNPKDFITVLHYAMRSVRHFVKHLIRDMEGANWDIYAAAAAIQNGVSFEKKNHKAFAFESFICREIFNGFNDPCFSIQTDHCWSPEKQRRAFFFDQFKKLKSASLIHFLKQNPSSPFGKFLKSKYLHLVHPKMEFSFSGNLTQRKLVNSGGFPETEFFKAFAEMGRRVWLLHCLAFSFDQQVTTFQARKGDRFSEVYMESVTDEVFAGAGEFQVAFTVVPGFQVGKIVVQSQGLSTRVRRSDGKATEARLQSELPVGISKHRDRDSSTRASSMAYTDEFEERVPLLIALPIISNMSSSDLSSPMHSMKSACRPFSAIDEKILSATRPLLTPWFGNLFPPEIRALSTGLPFFINRPPDNTSKECTNDRDDLVVWNFIDACLRHEGPIVIQQYRPVFGSGVSRSNRIDRQLSEIRIECYDSKTKAQTDSPTSPSEMVFARSLQILEEASRPIRYVMCANVFVMLFVAQLLLSINHRDRLV
nr:IRK-interacting protein [Ipomoea batatas]